VHLTRSHRWTSFLGAALFVNALCLAMVRLRPGPQVALGATLDLTIPALYFLLIVRAGLAPAVSVLPVCLVGLLRATYLAPALGSARPVAGALAEAAVIGLLAVRVRRGLRAARSTDLLERIEQAAREILPFRRAADILAGELAVFCYAFASWRRAPDIPAGARAFTIHRQSGAATLFGFLAAVSLMEAALGHLLMARWNVTAAWILTVLTVYGAIWLTAVARSFALRPILLTSSELIVRVGILWTVAVPRSLVTLDRPGAEAGLRAPILADPNMMLRLAAPAVARGLFGVRRQVTTIALALDEPAAFQRVF